MSDEPSARDVLEVDVDLRWLMSNPSGRRLVYRWLEESGLFSSSFAEVPTVAAFREGKRAWAVEMMQNIQAREPRLHTLMVQEAAARAELALIQR